MNATVMTQFDLVERQFNQVAALLVAGDAPQLQTAASLLQNLSMELARLLAPNGKPLPVPAAQRRRVLAMAKSLQMLRDNLSRQAAINQQALAVVVPTPTKSTYSGRGSVYGSVARQSGAFNVLAA